MLELVKNTAKNISVPLTVGGGGICMAGLLGGGGTAGGFDC